MRGTQMFGAAVAALLVTLAAGCGGSGTAAPVQTVDLSGLIEVDTLNEKLPIDKEQLETAIAETLQERAPAGVRVVYNPGAPPVQRFSQSGGGNRGGGKTPPVEGSPEPARGKPPPKVGDPAPRPRNLNQAAGNCRYVQGGRVRCEEISPTGGVNTIEFPCRLPASVCTGVQESPRPAEGTPAKPAPGEAAPSPAVCGFDPSKVGCENFCAQNPEFATCKKPAPGTPPPGTPAPAGGGKALPRPGDPAPKPADLADGVVEDCIYRRMGTVSCYLVADEGGGKARSYACPLPKDVCAAVDVPVGGILPGPTDDRGYSHCRRVGESSEQCYRTAEADPICAALPFSCGGGVKPPFLKGVIDDSFEKVGIDVSGSAGAPVPLAKVSIGGVKADIEASETGEIVTEVEEVAEGTSVSEQGEADGGGTGEPAEGEPRAAEPTEPEGLTDGTLPEEGTEPEGQAPVAPPEETPAPATPEPAPTPAPAPAPAPQEPTQ